MPQADSLSRLWGADAILRRITSVWKQVKMQQVQRHAFENLFERSEYLTLSFKASYYDCQE